VSLTILALVSLLAASPAGPALESVAELPERPGAIALVGPRLFLALHPLGNPETKLLELLPGGRRQPYPSGVLSRGFTAVTALAQDGAGGLWILDAGGEGKTPRLTGWNTTDERRLRGLRIPAAAVRSNSWLCALAVDRAHQVAFVADRSRADWTGTRTRRCSSSRCRAAKRGASSRTIRRSSPTRCRSRWTGAPSPTASSTGRWSGCGSG
jgi:hypothetical protein